MLLRAIVCSIVMAMGFDSCSPCYAQPSRDAALPQPTGATTQDEKKEPAARRPELVFRSSQPVKQEDDPELPRGQSQSPSPSDLQRSGSAQSPSSSGGERMSRFRGEIELGTDYRWTASDPVFAGAVQLVLGAQLPEAQLGAVLRFEAGGTLTGLPLLMPAAGFTALLPIHRRVRIGGTASLGLLAVQRASDSAVRDSQLLSYLVEVAADLKVDLYLRADGTSIYLHVAPSYEYFGLVGSGFVGRLAFGYRFGRSP